MLPLFFPAILITLLFLFSAFEKIYLFSKSTGKFAKKIGIPLYLAQIAISGAILLDIHWYGCISSVFQAGIIWFNALHYCRHNFIP